MRTKEYDQIGYRTIIAAEEIGKLREGVAVLRILQAHGINHLERRERNEQDEWQMQECTSIERMIDDAKRSAMR